MAKIDSKEIFETLPVPKAVKMFMISMLMVSTNDTPETAASPTLEIIRVSAKPTNSAKSCSKTRGMISFFRS